MLKKQGIKEITGFTPIEVVQLDNGLRLFLWQDTSYDTVTFNVSYKAGSLLEKPGITGIAHLFEHMMFRPGPYAPRGAWIFKSENFLSFMNANTRYKATNYQLTFFPEQLENIVQFEAGRMVNLPIDDEIT